MGKEVVLVLSSPFHPDSTIPFGRGGLKLAFFFSLFLKLELVHCKDKLLPSIVSSRALALFVL